MQKFNYSDQGLALTKSFEGLHLEAYQDCAGVWTIGYGHTGPTVSPGQSIIEAEAEKLLQADLDRGRCLRESGGAGGDLPRPVRCDGGLLLQRRSRKLRAVHTVAEGE